MNMNRRGFGDFRGRHLSALKNVCGEMIRLMEHGLGRFSAREERSRAR